MSYHRERFIVDYPRILLLNILTFSKSNLIVYFYRDLQCLYGLTKFMFLLFFCLFKLYLHNFNYHNKSINFIFKYDLNLIITFYYFKVSYFNW